VSHLPIEVLAKELDDLESSGESWFVWLHTGRSLRVFEFLYSNLLQEPVTQDKWSDAWKNVLGFIETVLTLPDEAVNEVESSEDHEGNSKAFLLFVFHYTLLKHRVFVVRKF